MTNTTKQNKGIAITVIAVVAIIALILGFYFAQVSRHKTVGRQVDASKFNGTLLTAPRQLTDFNLASSDDQNYTKVTLKGHWMLMFFGYTSCPQLCPMTMANLAKMYKQLQADGVKDLPEVILVSLDPKHDTPDRMKKYVTAFNPNFKGLVGDLKQIDTMTKQMGIVYMQVKGGKNADDYQIQHSGTIVLLNPQGDIAAYFSLPHDPAKIAADYEMLVS